MKQVIVLRKDLNMRKGKCVAQGSHACLYAYLQASQEVRDAWIGRQTKICVGVNSEAELVEIYNQAKTAGLPCVLIKDAGLTEFHGVETLTAVGIGPAEDEEVDKITGELKLL